ncbi:alpha/beta hydrolase [Mesobacillus maritimus]|uniref:alpha/beta hydrolase n=1 Tax=Mesobacillus maritimus TaxID=1643336 RepID=UPI00384A4D63
MDYQKGSIEELSLFSYALAEEMTLLVYTPASFSPLYKYTLLIAQDGKDYFQLGRIGRVVDELHANNEIENLIIVGIPYASVEDRRRKYHPEGAQQEAYIRFLAHELVPFLDKEYPTLQMGMGRALIGDSLAATVSFMAALEYPNTFGRVILQSPFVDENVLQQTKKFKKAELLNIYHTVGNKETEVKTTDNKTKDFLTPNRELSKLLQNQDGLYHYHEFEGGHFWTHWQPDIKSALKKMFSKQMDFSIL